jgi:membrane-associated protease RseP (regulator of RpoE activity)
MLLFFMPGGGIMAQVLWFWALTLMTLWLLFAILGAPRQARADPRELRDDEQPEPIREIMDVEEAAEQNGVQIFRGHLREPASSAYEKLKRLFMPVAVPLVQQDPQREAAILLVPKRVEDQVLERPVRPMIHWLLFGLTLITTMWAGAAHQGINLFREPEQFTAGFPYAFGLMAILGVHELGHYFTARKHGMSVTPPYFIPAPFALGTFGAFIRMRTPPEHRKALFDVAVAGPLAGLVIAIPALIIGLRSSVVIPEGTMNGTTPSSSLMMSVLARIAFGDAYYPGDVLRLSPLAFAGWLGLLVTALNLIPVGQLDGGHIARAMFGSRAGGWISSIAMFALFALALFVWPGLMLWAILVFFMARPAIPPLNDLTPIGLGRQLLGVLAFLILAAIIMPTPNSLLTLAAGVRCPYL